MDLGAAIESYKFGDIAAHWGRERLVHEVVVSRELARGIVTEGLRFQSGDPKWLKSSEPFRGYPYIGYCARPGDKPIVIRAEALEHLLAVMREAVDPDMRILSKEIVTKNDFRSWLVHTGRPLPRFWFGDEERASDA